LNYPVATPAERQKFHATRASCVWLTPESLTIERWAIRVQTICPTTYGNALLLVERFYLRGGDETQFTKLERCALEKGHDLSRLLTIIDDCNLLQRKVTGNINWLFGP
jgi:hypothetical protein